MTTLQSLAARCEGAKGADRELDEAIRVAVGGRRVPVMGSWVVDYGAPAYTASLDAAMGLVPEPKSFNMSHAGNSVARVDILPDGPEFSGYAPTPALALCAAALRARAAGEA